MEAAMHQLRSDRDIEKSVQFSSLGPRSSDYGWCKKAKHWGTYKNGKSGDADDLGPSEEN
jgi:hypothetical protein